MHLPAEQQDDDVEEVATDGGTGAGQRTISRGDQRKPLLGATGNVGTVSSAVLLHSDDGNVKKE